MLCQLTYDLLLDLRLYVSVHKSSEMLSLGVASSQLIVGSLITIVELFIIVGELKKTMLHSS